MKLKQLAAIAFLTTISTVASANLCAEGNSAQVLWKKEFYPATVLKAKDGLCFITYKGYDASYDEWVGPDRLRIKVRWKGDWYNASVIAVKGDLYHIRYDGYTSADDEHVPVSRISIR